MRSMDRKNRIKSICGVSVRTVSVRLLVMLLVAAMLCGCKPSPVLQKLVYAENEIPSDTADDPEDETEADTETEEDKETKDDSETEEDTEAGDDASESGKTDSGDTSGESDDIDDEADKAEASSDGEGGSGTGLEDGELSGDSDKKSGDVTELTDDLSGRLVIDADGVEVPVPQNIKTIAAVGPAATMVEMLAGEGVLVATDRELLANPLCRKMFSDIDSIEGLWPDAYELMDDESFARLLELKPDLCVEISGRRNFTSDQVLRLKESGIAYFVLPALSTIYGLKVSVVKLGEILGAERKAKEYCNYVDDIVDDMKDATEGMSYSTLYIADWIDEAEYELTGAEGLPKASGLVTEGGKQKGRGMAVAWSPLKDNLLDDFLGVCNITNESTAHKKKYNDTEYIYVSPLISQFSPEFIDGQVTEETSAGGKRDSGEETDKKDGSDGVDGKKSGTDGVDGKKSGSDGMDSKKSSSNGVDGKKNGTVDATFYKKITPGYDRFLAVKEDEGGLRLLGSEHYPCILVSSTEVMKKLDESWFWSCFAVENVPFEAQDETLGGAGKQTSEGKLIGAGPSEADWAGSDRVRPGSLESCRVSFGDKSFYSSICGSYTIIVNPYGTGDWAEGCVESPLEALCAASMIMGVYSQLDALFAAKNFYMKFFDYDISQEEIVDILSATYRPVRK